METEHRLSIPSKPFPFERFAEVFQQLPLDGCTLEPAHHQYLERHRYDGNPDHYQFVAPEGKVFKISGLFEVMTHSNEECCDYGMKAESQELRKKNKQEHPKDYDDDDIPIPLYEQQHFYGNRLSVSIGGHRFRSAGLPQLDPADENEPIVEVFIEGKTGAYVTWGEHTVFIEERSGTDIRLPYSYSCPMAFTFWYYDEAKIKHGEAKIELIDDGQPHEEFKIVKASKHPDDDKLWVPNNVTVDYMADRLESYGLETFDSAQRLAMMRDYRSFGMPFADDPLRDFHFWRGSADLDEVYEHVESLKGDEFVRKMANYILGIRDYSGPPRPKDPNYIKRSWLLGELALVHGDVSLDQLVEDERLRQQGVYNPDYIEQVGKYRDIIAVNGDVTIEKVVLDEKRRQKLGKDYDFSDSDLEF